MARWPLAVPANAVAWLANKLADRGRSLKAGMIVMTGTLTAITPIEPGATYQASFSTLGQGREDLHPGGSHDDADRVGTRTMAVTA